QAEDGIRDLYVTGVQTCALPIYRPGLTRAGGRAVRLLRDLWRLPVAACELPGAARLQARHRRGAASADRPLRGVEKPGPADDRRSEERRVGKGCRAGKWSYR